MDLTQSKLTKVEWGNVEIPVSENEKIILKLIKDGYENINIRSNVNQSLFQSMKVEHSMENELFLYKKYFEKEIMAVCEKYDSSALSLDHRALRTKIADFPAFSSGLRR